MLSKLDQNLWQLYQVDNTAGFNKIVSTFQERIYWQIRRMTKNHNDTEDILQNVFVKVWRGLPKFKAESAIYSWIYRIAFNETATFLKKEKKHLSSDVDDPIIENTLSVDGKTFSSQEISEVLMQAIATLPEKQAQVFQLKYFDDLQYGAISELLGTSVGGLKANYHIAVKKIEEFILNR
ncbi:MAG: sigma-70 family RNA polymerase sigma factor [Putridiphycobacter sp.]|jgi:RNA polymerase sigma factor (sigma-70 family)|nr:sigma-70 family RNA polymerase sigma factor [Putridiphycobacter sp.]